MFPFIWNEPQGGHHGSGETPNHNYSTELSGAVDSSVPGTWAQEL